MTRLLSIICALLSTSLVFGQTTYSTKTETPVKKIRTIDLRTVPQATAFVQYSENPKPGGDAYHKMLAEQKAKAAELFPEQQGALIETRSAVDPPTVVRSFSGNAFEGIPLDNHLAVNLQDQVVSVVNVHMLVTGPTGIWQSNYSLDAFWSDLPDDDAYFDPRIIYDPEADRFIIAMMQDFDCEGSNIVFAFSETNDPTGVWHMYSFDGCPNDNATFADFPMIALSQDELFFTYNAVYQDSSWQTGFNETFIYQINKMDGYAGEDLTWRSWSDIRHNGRLMRYICPVKYGTESLGAGMHFLSNRSFDIQNDTIWYLNINKTQDDPDVALTTAALIAENPYGVPPNARQPKDFLQTNDARVLDGFYVDGRIQFVSSTMDFSSGRSAVYHGIITDVSSNPVLSTEYLQNGTEHFAYPGIAYTGAIPGEFDAIIIASHASADRFPGYSAIYFNEEYSDWVTVREGDRNIDMFKDPNPFGVDPTLERWGDYSGIQRQWNEIGTVYTVSSYGKPGSVNDAWIGYLERPEGDPSSTTSVREASVVQAYPNPSNAWMAIEIETSEKGETLRASLVDMSGKELRSIYERTLTDDGPLKFHFDTSEFPSGSYIVRVTIGDELAASKQVVIQR